MKNTIAILTASLSVCLAQPTFPTGNQPRYGIATNYHAPTQPDQVQWRVGSDIEWHYSSVLTLQEDVLKRLAEHRADPAEWPRITNGYADTNQQPRKLSTNMVTTNVFGYYSEDMNGFLTLHLGATPVATPVELEDTGVAPQPPTELKVDTSSSFWVVTNNTPIITDHSGVRLTRWLESPVTQFTETDIQIGLAPDGTVVWRERK